MKLYQHNGYANMPDIIEADTPFIMAEYIEREAARKLACKICGDCDGGVDVCQFRDLDVDAIPAADVRPMVRGKWVADGDGYHWTYNCSVCGWKDGYPFNERHNYCPNCGADMREET